MTSDADAAEHPC